MLGNRSTISMLKKKLVELFDILKSSEERALIHCAAGIHRTGTMAYTLMRMDGRDPDTAYETLKTMRIETYKGVGDGRIEIAEKMLFPAIVKFIKDKVGDEDDNVD